MWKSCVSVKEGYERWAPTYDRDPNPLLALEERQLKLLILPLEGKRVLDLACGTGRWLGRFMASGAAFGVGLDISAPMLTMAQERAHVAGRLVQGDCRALPFANATFDLVVCSFAVGHIFELQKVAHEVGRVAASRADVFMSDLHPLAYKQGWRTRFHDHQGAAEITAWSRSEQELVAAWLSAGFEYVQSVECRVGEPERQIFAQTGRAHLFDGVCRIPGILILHFQRAN